MKTRHHPRVLRGRLIPHDLFELPAEVAEARAKAVAAIDAVEPAVQAARDARVAADRAPRQDAEAKREAIDAGRKPPRAAAPVAQEDAENARILADLTHDRAEQALAALGRVREAHRSLRRTSLTTAALHGHRCGSAMSYRPRVG
jgi:hypothetical protein